MSGLLHALILFGLKDAPAPASPPAATFLKVTVAVPALTKTSTPRSVPDRSMTARDSREKKSARKPSLPVLERNDPAGMSPGLPLAAETSRDRSSTAVNDPIDRPRSAAEVATPSPGLVSTALPDAGKPDASAANADSLRQYRLDLALAAQRFRLYPVQARTRGWEGVATVSLASTAGYSGPVLKVVRSSGHAVLDDQALQMLSQAAANTPLPENLRGQRFEMAIPIRFSLSD